MKIGLRQMANRQRGIIVSVMANGELGRRIRDMGLIPGTEIAVQGAPRCGTRSPCG